MILTAGVSTVSAFERPLWDFNDSGLLNIPSVNPSGKSGCLIYILCFVGVLIVLSFRLRSCVLNLIIYTSNCYTVSVLLMFNICLCRLPPTLTAPLSVDHVACTGPLVLGLILVPSAAELLCITADECRGAVLG